MDEGAVAKYHDPDPQMLARCTELRTLQIALALIVFRDDFGDMEGWDKSIGGMLSALASVSRRGRPVRPNQRQENGELE